MGLKTAINTAESLLLNGGSLGSFQACFNEDGDTVINELYHRALNNPKLKAGIVEFGVWEVWEQQIQ